VTVDLLTELRRQLSLVDPEKRESKASELVKALIDAGCDGDVKAIQEVISRVHGKLESRMDASRYAKHVEVEAMIRAVNEAQDAKRAALDEKARLSVMESFPDLSPEEVEEFIQEFKEAVQDRGVDAAQNIYSELCREWELIDEPDEPEPDPEPRPALPCGFRELDPPLIRPDPPIEPEPPWRDDVTAAAVDPANGLDPATLIDPGEYFEGMPGFSIKIDRGKER